MKKAARGRVNLALTKEWLEKFDEQVRLMRLRAGRTTTALQRLELDALVSQRGSLALDFRRATRELRYRRRYARGKNKVRARPWQRPAFQGRDGSKVVTSRSGPRRIFEAVFGPLDR